MIKLGKMLIVFGAGAAAACWFFALFALYPDAKEFVTPFVLAYPVMTIAGLWVFNTLGSMALVCTLEDDGVSWGAVVGSATLPGMFFWLGAIYLLCCGPMFATFALAARWFPNEGKPPEAKPPGHWTKRIAFRCPGKPKRAQVAAHTP